MAFPFIKFPTFAEFIGKLGDDYGVLLKDLSGDLSRNDEPPISIHYLEGEIEGRVIRCVVDIQDYDAPVSPSVLRSICARFGFNPEDFASTSSTTSALESEE